MVTIDMEATTVKAHAGIDDLRIYREFTDDPMDKLADVLKDLQLERSKVGIELEFSPAKDFQTLQKNLPGVHWIGADAIFNKARQIKTPSELALLRSLSKLTDRAIGDALRSAQVGMSEMELAGTLLTSLFGGGAIAARRYHSDGNLRPEERLPHRCLPYGGSRRRDTRAI